MWSSDNELLLKAELHAPNLSDFWIEELSRSQKIDSKPVEIRVPNLSDFWTEELLRS